MSNFAFVPDRFGEVAEAAKLAERQISGDPRAACVHARRGLELAVVWLYNHDPDLRLPYDYKLAALLHEPSFQNLLPPPLFQKARAIQKQGNHAAHDRRAITSIEAQQAVRELHHLCYWLVRTYTPRHPRDGAAWRDDRVPPAPTDRTQQEHGALQALEQRIAKLTAEKIAERHKRIEIEQELQQERAKLKRIREASQQQPDPHNYNEAETRRFMIDLDLRRAGWALDQKRDRELKIDNMPDGKTGYADYVLWGHDGKPLAVVEAKRTTKDAEEGREQAHRYARALEQTYARLPLIFYTNGYDIYFWDSATYPPRQVAGYYTRAELELLVTRRFQRQQLQATEADESIAGRPYQQRAIASVAELFTRKRRKALLVMATGTGKTRTAIALVDLLQRAGWVKRALFLADRVSLVGQAVGAFKTHLPSSSPVNLVTEKATEGRVYVSTYPTMMGLIDETEKGQARFGVGYFDLVIVDEAHRSVYQKFGAIFDYFDSLLLGLTATPRDQVDRNTYELFDLETGVPTDAYELATAVRDNYLVPPKARQVDLKFPGQGIEYDSLSKDEQEHWESLDWGDVTQDGKPPKRIDSGAINTWLFNRDTVDRVLQHLMEHGHRVEGGDRLAKTIIFARNHEHAKFIRERFDHHYPEYAGHFARMIDHKVHQAERLIDDFKIADRSPHIAISVDMLDTGIDVPEVANLVFFKPVYSRTKFWQMIGRGTRLCPELFGPGLDKKDFRIFDFCFNFAFFNENPDGINEPMVVPIRTRLFHARVDLIGQLQGGATSLDPSGALRTSICDQLWTLVAAMNRDNFIVRMHLESVDMFRDRNVWNRLTEKQRETLSKEVAGLPSAADRTDAVEARFFDLTMLHMQLACATADTMAFEVRRKRVVEIASRLEEKSNVPGIREQLEYLQALQDPAFWEGVSLQQLEEIRIRLRGVVHLLDPVKRKIVESDFRDNLLKVHDEAPVLMPAMTGRQYEKKVNDYLRDHMDNVVIGRLRMNQPLTEQDLHGLEQVLVEIGQGKGQEQLQELLQRKNALTVGHFVRQLIGLDRSAAQQPFRRFLSDRSLNAAQIRFVEMIVEQLTACGIVEPGALYEPPFTNVHTGGLDALFAGKETVIQGIFTALTDAHAGLEHLTG